MDLGNKIQQLRKNSGLSQAEFAELFHVSRQTVSNWENNKNYPDMETLRQISNEFGVSFDELLKDDEKGFLEMIEPLKYGNDNLEENYFSDKIKFIEKNGLQAYGVAVAADKATLKKLNMHENVYSIGTELY